jgi:hypothetical protein
MAQAPSLPLLKIQAAVAEAEAEAAARVTVITFKELNESEPPPPPPTGPDHQLANSVPVQLVVERAHLGPANTHLGPANTHLGPAPAALSRPAPARALPEDRFAEAEDDRESQSCDSDEATAFQQFVDFNKCDDFNAMVAKLREADAPTPAQPSGAVQADTPTPTRRHAVRRHALAAGGAVAAVHGTDAGADGGCSALQELEALQARQVQRALDRCDRLRCVWRSRRHSPGKDSVVPCIHSKPPE